MTEQDGFRIEAALQFGFQMTNDDGDEFSCTEAELIAFSKSCERKGMATTRRLADERGYIALMNDLSERITEIDCELDLALGVASNKPGMAQAPCEGRTGADIQRARLRELRAKHGEIYTIEQCGGAIVDLLDYLLEARP